MAQHTEYDGRELRCDHLGIKGTAIARHAWDDWYYVHVEGVARNGNKIKGIYCREQAHVIAQYLKAETQR